MHAGIAQAEAHAGQYRGPPGWLRPSTTMDRHGDVPTPPGFPTSIPDGPRRVRGARRGRDGDDRPDPVPHRTRDRPDARRRPLGPPHARAGRACRRRAAPRPDRGPPAARGPRLARRRARPAPADVRAPAVARARLLRPPADRPAHVARDGRPPVGALLPGLRPDLHAPVGAHDRARRGRDVRDAAPPRGDLLAARAVRRVRRRPLRPPLAARAARAPAAHRRADRGRRGERRRRARREGVRARGSPARALPRRRRPGLRPGDGDDAACRPSTTRSSASSPRSASRRSCSSAGARSSAATSPSASSAPSTRTC